MLILMLFSLKPFSLWNLEFWGGWTIFICHNNPDPVKGQMIAAYTITTITVIIFMAIVCHQDSRKLFNRKTLLMEVAVLPIVYVTTFRSLSQHHNMSSHLTRKLWTQWEKHVQWENQSGILLRLPILCPSHAPIWMSWESHCCTKTWLTKILGCYTYLLRTNLNSHHNTSINFPKVLLTLF